MNQPRLLLRALPRRSFKSLTSRRAPRPFDTTGRADGFARRTPKAQPPGHSPRDQSTEMSATQNDKVANALQQMSTSDTNNLLAPVHIPEDKHGVLQSSHPATSILANSSIVVQRQLEMMNVMLGFEQANKYIIMDGQGNHIGYLAEQDHGFGSAMARQLARTHRSFTTHVFDKHENEILRFHRPFSWINSRIRIYDAASPSSGAESYSSSDALSGTSAGSISSSISAKISTIPQASMRIIGEAQQQWAPLRRKYNLFIHRDTPPSSSALDPQLTSGDLPLSNPTALAVSEGKQDADATGSMTQFAYVDEPFLSWDFSLKSADEALIGSVNRNFAGFAREIFTDTGVYALRMDSAGLGAEPEHLISHTARAAAASHGGSAGQAGMTLDQRAVMLATAVSIDFDYFSRHSGAGGFGGGFMPMWFPGMGGSAGAAGEAGAAGAGGAAAGEAGAVGGAVSEAGAAGVGGAAARGVGGVAGSEGAMAGAGTLAGYEAMQGMRNQEGDDASPTNDAPPPPMDSQYDQPLPQGQQAEDFWGGYPPSDEQQRGDSSGGEQGGEGGEGSGFSLWDFFDGGE